MRDLEKQSEIDPIAMRAIEQNVQHWGGVRSESLLFGFIAGSFAALLCAVGWATFTIATGMQLGILAIALGMLVGVAVRYGGSGWDSKFGVMAAILAFAGCVLGNYLSIIAVIVRSEEGLSYLQVILGLEFSGALDMMIDFFGVMDILFYFIAVTTAYRMGYRD